MNKMNKKHHRHRSRFFVTVATLLGGSFGLWASMIFLPQVFSFYYPDRSLAEAPSTVSIVALPPPPPRHLPTPGLVRGVYMSSWVAGTKDMRDDIIKLVRETEANAIVIDVKDYTGRISFEVDDAVLQNIGSPERRIADIKELIASLHQEDIYVIGRIAVFQDPFLAQKRPDLAVKRSSNGSVWQDYKGAKWLDPAAREVWDYAVAIGRAAERVGFDELNFDYIRFPSDGNMEDISYPFFGRTNPPVGEAKAATMREFFAHLRNGLGNLGIPLSVDFFGMTTTNTDDLNIGQLLEDGLAHFDYVAPMVYPSHYPPGFLQYKNPAAYPYEIIKHSMDAAINRAAAAGRQKSQLRPWLQDFNLGAVYTAEMVRKEKQAVYDAGLTSWLLWSPSNRYTGAALDAN